MTKNFGIKEIYLKHDCWHNTTINIHPQTQVHITFIYLFLMIFWRTEVEYI